MNTIRVSKEFQDKLIAHNKQYKDQPYSEECLWNVVDLTCHFAKENGLKSHMLWSDFRQPDKMKCPDFSLDQFSRQKARGYTEIDHPLHDNKTTFYKSGRTPMAVTYRLPLKNEYLEKFPNLIQYETDLPHFLPVGDANLTFLFHRDTKVIWT